MRMRIPWKRGGEKRITGELHNRRRQEEQYKESTVVIIEGRQWDHHHRIINTITTDKHIETKPEKNNNHRLRRQLL
jgi:hypothetical protein